MSLTHLHPVGTHLRHWRSLSKIHSVYKLFWSELEPGISIVLKCIVILALNFSEMRSLHLMNALDVGFLLITKELLINGKGI